MKMRFSILGLGLLWNLSSISAQSTSDVSSEITARAEDFLKWNIRVSEIVSKETQNGPDQIDWNRLDTYTSLAFEKWGTLVATLDRADELVEGKRTAKYIYAGGGGLAFVGGVGLFWAAHKLGTLHSPVLYVTGLGGGIVIAVTGALVGAGGYVYFNIEEGKLRRAILEHAEKTKLSLQNLCRTYAALKLKGYNTVQEVYPNAEQACQGIAALQVASTVDESTP